MDAAKHAAILTHNVLLARDNDEHKNKKNGGLGKPAIIGIAVSVAIVFLAAVGLLIFCCMRKRRHKHETDIHSRSLSEEKQMPQLNGRGSKMPLIRYGGPYHDEHQQTSSHSNHEDDDDVSSVASEPYQPRGMSSLHSLPLIYTGNTPKPPTNVAVPNSHQPKSSQNGSAGLRPLLLSGASGGRSHSRSHSRSNSQNASPERKNLSPPANRARSGSKFSEDIDM